MEYRCSFALVWVFAGLMLSGGCASLPGFNDDDAPPPQVIDRSKKPAKVASKSPARSATKAPSKPKTSSSKSSTVVKDVPAKASAKPKPETNDRSDGLPSVAVLVSAEIPAMTTVAERIKARLGYRAQIYALKGDAQYAATLAKQLAVQKNIQVVAIGLLAAKASKTIPHPQVFSQVFNFSEFGLLRDGRRGVNILPPADQVFSFWRKLSPGLRVVAVATGPNQSLTVNRLQQGARLSGIRLHHIEVRSDKELVYALKQVEEAQGIWLLPDNRVLSRSVIRELMNYTVKNGKQLAVFSPQLLEAGALLSFSTNSVDVSERILEQLRLLRQEEDLSSQLVSLKGGEMKINSVVASRLGIRIPATLKSHIHNRIP
ncbi:hypothetical protein MIB92_06025 [Aestuariirhabdus sp. Z084]|uniref:ABC transporter substrate-binding protein n=1 Tax=Aestuariirhabdus haliotis TaxID=2918751 RepID=UPI00201B4465|nr:ABC transporter substrate binding protein [Aestuariirhabdus haliotis]MCL6415199.1 hypothetical protein [Aestuariirhabdus haliotis]MCL6420074.1 hypothetical protein [Aestuariirhabdus haliotis]